MRQSLSQKDTNETKQKPLTGKGSGKPRGRYKPRKKIIIPLSMYQRLDELRFQLALVLDSSLLFRQCESFTKNFKFFTLHFEKYIAAPYIYQGEIFQGDNFKIIQAELKGTENLRVKENLYIHKKLIRLIEYGYTAATAALLLQPMIKRFKSGAVIFSDVDNSIKEIVINGEKDTLD